MKQRMIWIGSLLLLITACSSFTEETTTVDSTQQDALATEFQQSVLPQYLDQIHADSQALERLPLDERQAIAQENGISSTEDREIRSELALFIEDLGLEPSEFELLETPYFYVDGKGEVTDPEVYKGLFSFIKMEREKADAFNEGMNALYEEYQPHIDRAIDEEDSVEVQRLMEEYEKKRTALVE